MTKINSLELLFSSFQSLNDPQFLNEKQLCYIESRGGSCNLMIKNLDSGLSFALTKGISPRGSISYGGGSFSCHQQKICFAGHDKNIHIYDLEQNQQFRIASHCEGVAHPKFSPCGKFVLFLGEKGSSCNVYAATIESKHPATKLSQDPWYAFNPHFSSDGQHIIWHEWNKNSMPWQESKLVLAQCESNSFEARESWQLLPKTTTTIEQKGFCNSSPSFSPDGKHIAYLSDQSGWRSIYIAETKDPLNAKHLDFGKQEVGGPDWLPGMRHYQWANNETLVCLIKKDCHTRIISYNLNEQEITEQQSQYSYIEDLSVAGDQLAFIASSPQEPPQLITSSLARPTTSLNKLHTTVRACTAVRSLKSHQLQQPEVLTWQHQEGHSLQGLLYRASNGKKSAPLIIHLHGGPSSQSDLGWRPEAHLFAKQGYHFFSINYRGSTGYGKDFQDKLLTQWGLAEAADAKSAAEHIIDLGIVEKNQTILFGGSAGGYSALMAISQHDQFWSGAISMYGISNLYDLQQESHRFEQSYNDLLLGPLPQNAEAWKNRSPINLTHNIKTPLLLFHGKLDKAVPYKQSQMLYESLKAQGSLCQFISFDDEGHGFKKEKNKTKLYQSIFAFLDKFVICQQVK